MNTDEDTTLAKAIGQRIIARRVALGVTRADLATFVGLTNDALRYGENGRRLKIASLLKIAEALDMSLEELLRGP